MKSWMVHIAFPLLALLIMACGLSKEKPVETLAEAKAHAAEKNRKILVQMSTVGCKDCAKFNKSMEESSKLQEALKKVVFIDLDVTSTDGKQLMEKYNIRAFPTYLLLNADDSINHSWYGFFGAREWVKTLEAFLAK